VGHHKKWHNNVERLNLHNAGGILSHLTSSRLCASRRPVHRRPRGACEFCDESANNVWNEVVTIHRSQEVLKMPSSTRYNSQNTGGVENAVLYTRRYFLQLIFPLKTQVQHSSLHLTAHQTPSFAGWLQQLCCRSCTRL
jgi:hypothetical protein